MLQENPPPPLSKGELPMKQIVFDYFIKKIMDAGKAPLITIKVKRLDTLFEQELMHLSEDEDYGAME